MKDINILLALSCAALLGSAIGLPATLPEEQNNSKENAVPDFITVNHHGVEKRAINKSACVNTIYIMAFTSGMRNGHAAEGTHAIEILASGHVRHLRLYNRPGDDMSLYKGDLWRMNLTDFNFPDRCITLDEIERVYIVENSVDGWHIDSVVTLVKNSGNDVKILTRDLDVNRWVYNHVSSKRLELTLA